MASPTPLFFSIHALMESIESVDVVLFSLLSIQWVFFLTLFYCSDCQISQCVAWLIKVVSKFDSKNRFYFKLFKLTIV